jgi:hypothetical protein
MKQFAEGHEDPRVLAIYKRMESSRSLAAKWCESHAKLEMENARLTKELAEASAVLSERKMDQ